MKQPWEDVDLNFFCEILRKIPAPESFLEYVTGYGVLLLFKDAILESVKDLGEVDFLQLDAFSVNWNLGESFDKENDLIILLTLLAVPNTVFMMHYIQGLCP